MNRSVMFVAMVVCAGGALRADDAPMLSVFPPSTYTATEPGKLTMTDAFTPTPGPWMEGLDERDVFAVSMKHEQGASDSYELRVGVGGQVYSLRGPFGESVPPSYRAGGPSSPWNDEVWQFVAVCSRYNEIRTDIPWLAAAAPYQTGYFVHNSGCYMKGVEGGTGVDTKLRNLYCPQLAKHADREARAYRQLNWGLIPQMKTIHRSPILFYTQVRDAGGGVIELTWVVHNFSVRDDIVFDHLNAPWGGTRVSSLPLHYASRPDGSLELDGPDNQRFANGTNTRNTGGFAISSAGADDDSPSLALVYGLDKHLEAETAKRKRGEPHVQVRPSLYRAWLASAPAYKKQWKDFATRPAASFRNYQVVEIIPRLRLEPGATIWYRSYLVVGPKERSRKLARELVDHVDYGSRKFTADDTPRRRVEANGGAFELFMHPVERTLPVFALRDKRTGATMYTTDPYRFTPQQKLKLDVPRDHEDFDYYSNAVGYTLDGQTEYLGLLGFAYRDRPKEAGWAKLSTVAGDRRSAYTTIYDVDVWVKPVPATRP